MNTIKVCGVTRTGQPMRLLSLRRHQLWTSKETSRRMSPFSRCLTQTVFRLSTAAFKAFARMKTERVDMDVSLSVPCIMNHRPMVNCHQNDLKLELQAQYVLSLIVDSFKLSMRGSHGWI